MLRLLLFTHIGTFDYMKIFSVSRAKYVALTLVVISVIALGYYGFEKNLSTTPSQPATTQGMTILSLPGMSKEQCISFPRPSTESSASDEYLKDFGINQAATTTQFAFNAKPLAITPSTIPAFVTSESSHPLGMLFLYRVNHRVYVGTHGQSTYACPGSTFDRVTERLTTDGYMIGSIANNGEFVTRLYEVRAADEIAEPASVHFASHSSAYLADSEGVYLIRYDYGGAPTDYDMHIMQLPGADPASFEVIYEDTLLLAKDKHAVYVQNKILQGADPNTFISSVGRLVFRDKNGYYEAKSTTEQNLYAPIDPFTVDLIPIDISRIVTKSLDAAGKSSPYSKDAAHVYFDTSYVDGESERVKRIVEGANPDTFILLSGLLDFYSSRGEQVYMYARDKAHVYYAGSLVVGADSATFVPLENSGYVHRYGSDKTRVFFEQMVIADADPATFKILWSPPYEGCSPGRYAEDARHVFYKNALVPGADPKTFEVLVSGTADEYGKDARGYYKGTQFIGSMIDSKVLECNYG